MTFKHTMDMREKFLLIFIYLAASGLAASVAACRLFIVVYGLSCSTTCGILLPRLRIEPASPALEGRF